MALIYLLTINGENVLKSQ